MAGGDKLLMDSLQRQIKQKEAKYESVRRRQVDSMHGSREYTELEQEKQQLSREIDDLSIQWQNA